MKNGFQIIGNDILIDATPAFCALYNSSKDLLETHPHVTDKFVSMINTCDSYLVFLSDPKYDFLEFKTSSQVENAKYFLNITCIMMSVEMDLSISARELVLAKNLSEQSYYIKQIYILLYRYFERINSELGTIKNLAKEFNLYDDYKKTIKLTNDFRALYYDRIKSKRNKLYAHITDAKDYREYHADIVSTNVEEEAKMCLFFMTASKALNDFLKQIAMQVYSEFIKIKEEIDNYRETLKTSAYSQIEVFKELNIELYNETKAKFDSIFEEIK